MTEHAYRDPARSAAERTRDLMARMELREKLAQLGAVWAASLLSDGRFAPDQAEAVLEHGTGQVTRIAGSTALGPRECAELTNAIQKHLLERTRLGVPALIHEESCAGFTARGATQFPQAIALASSFDPELVERVGRVIRQQLLAVGARQTLAPVLDVVRDARWGRMEETFGEDPYLVSRLGVAYVRAVQGEPGPTALVATAKHFAGYGVPEGGLNWAPTALGGRRELLERVLPPFAAAVREAGVASVMNGYQELDGVPCGASRWLLTELLRDELGFRGTLVADYFTVNCLMSYHRVAGSPAEAAARALAAGLDVELPMLDCYRELEALVERGDLELGLVHRALERVLRQKLELGLFDYPYVDAGRAPEVFDTPAQRALARDAAERSLVLLTNDGVLPLDAGALSGKRVAVLGPNADSRRNLQGDYHYPAHLEVVFGPVQEGSHAPRPDPSQLSLPGSSPGAVDLTQCFTAHVTVLAGLRQVLPEDTVLDYQSGGGVTEAADEDLEIAARAAAAADLIVLVVGDRSGLVPGCTSGEGTDRASLGLPGRQSELVRRVAAAAGGKPLILVLVNGRPVALPELWPHANAILEAWLPGEEGGSAVARALVGLANPAGRLPVSVPRGAGQLPQYYNHKPSAARSQFYTNYADEQVTPLFPFGHGLSYTRFEYSALELSSEAPGVTDTLTVRCKLENVGERAGDEVVQLYVRDRVARVTRPVKELKGFKRVSLSPGQACRVSFELDLRQLAYHDEDMRHVVEPGELRVMLGASSADIRLERAVQVRGELTEVPRFSASPTRVVVDEQT